MSGSGFAERLRAEVSASVGRVVVWDWTDADRFGPAPLDVDLLILLISRWTTEQLSNLPVGVAPILPVRQVGATTVIGPVTGAGAGGCAGCAEESRLGHQDPPGDLAGVTVGAAPGPAVLLVLAALIGTIARDPAAAAGTLWMLHGANAGKVSHHRVVPRPDCPVCRPVPPPGPDGAAFAADGPSSWGSEDLRRPNPAVTGDRLSRALVDERLGPVRQVRHTDGLALPLASAEVVVDGHREWGYGRGETATAAARIALFEAVERQLAMRPHGRRPVLRAAFAELGPERAIDPVTLGLPDPLYQGHPDSRLTPYRPDRPTRWVQGWSLTRSRAVAVPEHVAYYAVPASAEAPHFVEESSNGCGLGGSLAEAALYGLFEVAERDAFLMAWYAMTPLRRVAVPEDDRLTAHLVDQLDTLGYDLLFFDATNDLRVPTVVSLALARDRRGGTPQAYFSAGAHLHPPTALRSAAQEAAVGLPVIARLAGREADRNRRDQVRAMLADSSLVRGIDDHVAVNALPEARPRYEFLLGAGAPASWTELWPESVPEEGHWAGTPDPVGRIVDQLADEGLETVVVDQTDPWTRDRLGLHAAKVIVPGTLPMTFGHIHHRTRGFPRLLEVPHRLGRSPAGREYADLPLHPHPFP